MNKRDKKMVCCRKTHITGIKYALVLIVCVLFCIYIGQYHRLHAVSVKEGDFVRSDELAGYLQMIPMTPDETRAILLPELGEYLTGKDVEYLFHYLQISQGFHTVQEQIDYEPDEKLTRRKWCMIYEILLDTLGLKDQVESVKIQYLGTVPHEERLMADNGNYDCDLESIDFEYGKKYEVYVWQNKILGKKSIVSALFTTRENKIEQKDSQKKSDEQNRIFVPNQVRVVLSQDNQEKKYRSTVYVKGSGTLDMQTEKEEWKVEPDQVTDCVKLMNEKDCGYIKIGSSQSDRICICDANGHETSSYYRGSLIVYGRDGSYWIVNELGLEEYLYGVVPGEMPESFEAEALKTQAVCARTYACFQIADHKYEEFWADLTDTTDSQVYLPSKENEKSILAVDATAGEILTFESQIANIYYFSTSCGFTSGMEVWNTADVPYLEPVSLLPEDRTIDPDDFDAFIKDKGVEAYDSESRFFRWTAELDPAARQNDIKTSVQKEYEKNTGKLSISDPGGARLSDCGHIGNYQDMVVIERSASGAITDLQLTFENGIVHIYNENAIRTVLGAAMTGLKDKNEKSANTLHILPSAMFSIEKNDNERIVLFGGGLGHGIGMSQYGADGMAKAGMNCEQILQHFFPRITVTGKNSD